jgi:hypothetical protein
MKKLFNNILVPLRSEDAGSMILEEVERMAGQWQCRIHTLDDPDEETIVGYCIRHEIDLILLERQTRGLWYFMQRRRALRTDRLLKRLQCPILTISGQPATASMKNIVLPVGTGLPTRKLLFATYLARTAGSTIHLVTMNESSGKASRESGESLFRSYRLLRENTSLPVECLSLPGESLADVAWRYARDIKADLILVNPGKESLLSGWSDGWFTRAIFNVSRIPVLTVI